MLSGNEKEKYCEVEMAFQNNTFEFKKAFQNSLTVNKQ